MIVKICGLRSLDDAQSAVHAGADMLGFNFYRSSPRYVDPVTCAKIISGLRETECDLPVLVGVFVNATVSEIDAVLRACGLDLAQLHGDECEDELVALKGRAFKAVRPASADAARASLAAYRRAARHRAAPDILLDASAHGLYGGSGHTADWSIAASLAAEARLLLAGGLHPANVGEAVTAVRPWGVDVASGVESAPGVKDAAKMRLFVQQARGAEKAMRF